MESARVIEDKIFFLTNSPGGRDSPSEYIASNEITQGRLHLRKCRNPGG